MGGRRSHLGHRDTPSAERLNSVDYGARQQHWFETMATQHVLAGMSDNPVQFRQDPMMALLNQAYRARSGQDDVQIPYLSVPF
jgi:hypothetical protein